jgi:hypothetical protein
VFSIQLFGPNEPYVEPKKLKEEHEKNQPLAIEEFNRIPKFCYDEFSIPYLNRLEDYLKEDFQSFAERNGDKRGFKNKLLEGARKAFCDVVGGGTTGGVIAVTLLVIVTSDVIVAPAVAAIATTALLGGCLAPVVIVAGIVVGILTVVGFKRYLNSHKGIFSNKNHRYLCKGPSS